MAQVTVDVGEPVAVGNLVVIEGTLARGRIRGARVVEQCPGSVGAEPAHLAPGPDNPLGARLRARALALQRIRRYFDRRDFIEVDTPIRVHSPGLDAYVDAVRAEDGWLITSPELCMKRLLVFGLPRIYQLARCTRAGELGSLHEPEFLMLEWYRAFAGHDEVMRDTELLVADVVEALSGRAWVSRGDRRVHIRPPFERLGVREAFRRYAGVENAVELARSDEGRYFDLFVERVEPALQELPNALFLVDFPATQAGLARLSASDPTVAERFELFIGGVEVSNGFGELTDAAEQRRRFLAEQERRRRAGAPVHPVDERFLSALEVGMPPSAGNALGVDRLVALALGVENIADVQAFPRAVL